MKKLFAMTVAVLLLFSVLLGIPAAYGQAPETGKTLDILFSHDTHSHLNTFTTVVEDEEADIGGFARANTLIKAQRAKDPDTLVIDGGDFSMGTLIQTVFETQAAELRMLGYMGYDVTTFGNHEFDYRSKGLANMLTSARTSGDAVPSIVVCNVDCGMPWRPPASLRGSSCSKTPLPPTACRTTPWCRRAMCALPWWAFSARMPSPAHPPVN